MSEGYSHEERFIADSEMMDALRMEASSISPEMKESVSKISESLSGFLIERYGSHISDNTKKRIEDLSKRVIVVGEEDFTNFKNAWLPKLKESRDSSMATQTSIGDFIILSAQESLLEEAVKYALENEPNLKEEHIRTNASLILVIPPLVHEVLHAHQDPDTTRKETEYKSFYSREALDECGVCFITNEIMQSALPHIPNNINPELIQRRAAFFENIKNKYGDSVYDVLFGNVPEEGKEEYLKLERDIFSEFTPKDLVELEILDEKYTTLL